MPIHSSIRPCNLDDGSQKDGFVVEFTNGAWDQLKALAAFFKQENELELLKLGISALQSVKEAREEPKRNETQT